MSKFIPFVNQEQLEEDEKYYTKRYGECYKCVHHCAPCGVCRGICVKTGIPLTYPIQGCYGKKYN